jgi:CRISPR-associated protein Csd1
VAEYYLNKSVDNNELCYITGERNSRRAKFHPKKINNQAANAKLISANDSINFTYRGRFTDETQPLNVSYLTSQKVHQALIWLIKNISFRLDSQAIVAWAVGRINDDLSPCEADFNPFSWENHNDDEKTDDDIITELGSAINRPYAEKIRNAILGLGEIQKNHTRPIDIMAVDAATTGRMSVTFFEQLPEDAYLETVEKWHTTAAWFFRRKGNLFIGAPSVYDIIEAAHGANCDDKIKKYERSRLLHTVFRGARLPLDLVTSAVNNASRPESFDTKETWRWNKVLNTACALTRKYIFDTKKELFSMTLDTANTDRDYLWGRLLAIAEKIESHARFLQGVVDVDKRPTNALRLMSSFRAHPFRTWNSLFDQLQPYRDRLNGAEWYQKQIDEIMSLFNPDEYEDNKPLDGKYLMGYSLQRMQLNNNKKSEENDNELTEQN